MRAARPAIAGAALGLGLGSILASGGCQALVGIREVVVVDADASDAAPAAEPDAARDPRDAARDRDVSPDDCLGPADVELVCRTTPGSTELYGTCSDTCHCQPGLFCNGSEGRGRCCKPGACGDPCNTPCDCASQVCVNRRCR